MSSIAPYQCGRYGSPSLAAGPDLTVDGVPVALNRTNSYFQSKKDVTITYTPLNTTPKAGEQFRFNDVVEYRSLSSSSSTSKRSRIEGTDALLPTPPSAPNGYTSAISYQWRGKVCYHVCNLLFSQRSRSTCFLGSNECITNDTTD
jgi:hypothetical protein